MSVNDPADPAGFSSEELELLALFLQEEGVALPQRPSILPRDRDDHLPLSFAQERLWFIDQWDPGNPAYNIPATVRLSGRLDLVALRWSLAEVLRRHEALRTIFPMERGQPFQVITPAGPRPLPLLDLLGLPAERREAEMFRLARAEARYAFDLARGPLLRVTLLRLAPTEHLFLMVMHHIIFDGWSLGLFIKELSTLYQAFVLGQPSPLPDPPIQYADFALWQRQWLQGQVLDQHLAYWREQLRPPLPVLDLPTDRPRPPVQTFRGAYHLVDLPQPLFEALTALSQREGATLFMILLAAFDVLLARYSGQNDIIVGSPIANRDMVEIEWLIGYFVNTLLLRTRLSGRMSFRALLEQVRETTLDAYAHQSVPFEQLVDLLRPERDPSRTPLFQVMFVFQNITPPTYEFPELTFSQIPVGTKTAKFDLLLGFGETETGINGGIEYNTDLFDESTIIRMLTRYQMLLESIVADLSQPVAELPLLSTAERQQLLLEWNDIAPGVRGQGSGVSPTIYQLFETQAERTPDAVAVVFDETTNDQRPTTNDIQDKETSRQGDKEIQGRRTDNGSVFSVQHSSFIVQSLTYQELNARANQLARYLRALGVGPEVRVAIWLNRSPELLVALLGVLKARGAYVPLDPSYPAERIAFMLEDSGATVVVTMDSSFETRRHGDTETDDLLVSLSPPLLVSQTVVDLRRDWPRIAGMPDDNLDVAVDPANLAYVIYTSGSTGAPKGVAVAHSSVVNYTAAACAAYALAPHDRVLQFASISFDASAEEIYPTLSCGATLVLRSDAMLATPARFFQVCRAWAISVLNLPTAYWHDLSAALQSDAAALPPAIRLLIIGGEQVLRERALVPRPAGEGGAWLVNTYGPTEATIVATAWTIAEADLAWREVPIGRPIQNAQIYICDPSMRLVPIGAAGEIYIGGAGVARGYLGRPELTATRFIPNPFTERLEAGDWRLGEQRSMPASSLQPLASRLYKTGDRAHYRPDGVIEFLGRLDGQVKLRGYRIELGEIEAVLQQHPQVQESVVVLREDPPGDKRLVAYVVPRREQGTGDRGQENVELATASLSPITYHLSPTELRTFLKERLPAYMVPATFVVLEALPLTPSGKVDRRALPPPDTTRPQLEQGFVAPQTQVEQELAAIWGDVLRIEQIGLHDNFFDLGGHSLMVTQVISRVQIRFDVELKVRDLFTAPTLQSLAEKVEDAVLTRLSAAEFDEMLDLLEDMDEDDAQIIATGGDEVDLPRGLGAGGR